MDLLAAGAEAVSAETWGGRLSTGQVTFFLVYGWVMLLWLLSEYLNYTKKDYVNVEASDVESKSPDEPADATSKTSNGGETKGMESLGGQEPDSSARVSCARKTQAIMGDSMHSGFVRCMLFDLNAIQKERSTLKAMAEFGTLMVWYFVCDRTSFFSTAGKDYNRDVFVFIFLGITAAAFCSSITPAKVPQLLNRQQTEEWKGWMQVLFLLYHYFEAREAYNAIRLFIAAYVWMTGFGNFTYYYKTGDYCIGRFSQMMWRLNFLVFFACLVLGNSYMLYYICPMHTIFTVLVYASLGIGSQYNQYTAGIWIKMVLCVLAILVLWDLKVVFYTIWAPFTWLVGYVDPRKEGGDSLYEWYFRSSLDRFIWIYGMLCAFLHPQASSLLNLIDNMAAIKRYTMRLLILSVVAVVGYFWFIHVYCLPKVEYNKVHPYTSWIPITLLIIVRNMTPTLRLNSLKMYGWLGCITLETYISQFHIWLNSAIPNGQPKYVLSLVPGYPLINFALCTAAYIFVSHRLFDLTNTLKNVAVPHSNNRLLARNSIMLALAGVGLYMTTAGLLAAVGR